MKAVLNGKAFCALLETGWLQKDKKVYSKNKMQNS